MDIHPGGFENRFLVIRFMLNGDRVAVFVEPRNFLEAIRHENVNPEFALKIEKELRKAQSSSRIVYYLLASLFILGLLIYFLWDNILLFVLDLTPHSVDRSIGELAYTDFVMRNPPLEDDDLNEAIEEIRAKLVSTDPLLVKYYNITVVVVKNSAVNAFALPDGHVVIFSGLICEANSSDEIAGVLAHELGHISNRHQMKILYTRLGTTIVLTLIASSVGIDVDISKIATTLIHLSYTREQEKEADLYAVDHLVRAGIDPHGYLTFFRRLIESGGDVPYIMAFLSDHPAMKTRIKYIEDAISRYDVKPHADLPDIKLLKTRGVLNCAE